MNRLEIAKRYITRGWAVFPIYEPLENGQCACGTLNCKDNGKHPRTSKGFKDATTSPQIVDSWWTSWPTANIGIATGEKSGFVVIDIDPRHSGDLSIAEFEKANGSLPATLTVKTGGGGLHLLYQYPGSVFKNRVNFLPGVDLRGDGGYIVAAGSKHASGSPYSWLEGFGPEEVTLAPFPNAMLAQLNAGQKANRSNDSGPIPEGGRNDYLFKFACSLRAKIEDPREVERLVFECNERFCKPPLDRAEVLKILESSARYGTNQNSGEWSSPSPLPPLEMEVPSLPSELIPEALQPWILDVVERMQSSSEMITAPVIVVCSGLIGRRIGMKPKTKDDWTVIPNLWGGIVAPPSAMKTPAMKEALRQVRKIEADAKEKYLSELVEHRRRLEEDEEYEGEEPKRKRRMTNDATIEKLGVLLNENPHGLIVFRDELFGFLMNMEKSGHESDRQFYLEAYNGDGGFTWDRIIRGTVDVPALCLSLLGGIQPDRISSYFSATVKNGSGDDGFLSRFQVMVYPPRNKEWELVDRYPDQKARERASETIARLSEIDFLGHGFFQGPYDEIPCARFDEEAQGLFYDWMTRLEKRLRSGEIESPAFEAHLTKYKKLGSSRYRVGNFCQFS